MKRVFHDFKIKPLIYYCNYYSWQIPKRIQKFTKIKRHKFLVLNPRPDCLPLKLIVTQNGQLVEFSNAAYCLIKKERKRIYAIVEKDKFPILYDSICAIDEISSMLPLNQRYSERYMKIYKSYEALQENIDFEFRAIRHALSHSPHILSNKKTANTLMKLFGTKQIDLSNPTHKKVFYVYFAKLIIEHDKALYRELIKQTPLLKTANKIIKVFGNEYVFYNDLKEEGRKRNCHSDLKQSVFSWDSKRK